MLKSIFLLYGFSKNLYITYCQDKSPYTLQQDSVWHYFYHPSAVDGI